MKDDRKAEIRRHYGELLDVQKQLRALAGMSGTDIELEGDPPEPTGVDQLAEAMNVVRNNMIRVQGALNDWDRRENGCEIRTRSVIEEDISRDLALLAQPGSDSSPRSREEVELNIGYDEIQLNRM